MGASKTFVPSLWGSVPAQADTGCQAPTALLPSHAPGGVELGWGPKGLPLSLDAASATWTKGCRRIVAQGSHLVVAVTHLPAPAETSPKLVPKTHQTLQVLETSSLLG